MLGEHSDVIKDATYVVENLDSVNEKALFRRAISYDK
jgi:hypothetical protein